MQVKGLSNSTEETGKKKRKIKKKQEKIRAKIEGGNSVQQIHAEYSLAGLWDVQ